MFVLVCSQYVMFRLCVVECLVLAVGDVTLVLLEAAEGTVRY